MKLQLKPSRWGCIVTSFAMALDIPVAELMTRIGHDGSDKVFDGFPEPMCRRGFHVQECIAAAMELGHAVTPVELFPVSRNFDRTFQIIRIDAWLRFIRLIENTRGVITGQGKQCGHAVAYNLGRIFDPDGREYDYSREACEARGFITQCLWIVTDAS